MTDWTAGYVSDINYIFGYYAELNPLRLRLAFLNARLVAPAKIGAACELGFGQGLSINLHAAASVSEWFGTDFNPAQAGFAQELAAISGAGARLFDQSFAEFCERSDLPEFDYIGLHGTWSWISDENRAVIVDFVRRKLKVGGVFYISYNTQPGWATMMPMRDLLTEHGEVMGAPGQGIVSRIDEALAFAEKLLATNPAYTRANPQVVERLKAIKGQDRSYVAHEYFNRDWVPMSFARMSEWLAPAKLNFACSANCLDAIDAMNLRPEQQVFLKEISDPMFRETVRDFMVNQQFRRDYWVRGARKLNPLEQAEALRRQRVMLVAHRADISLKVIGAQGEATLQEHVYVPILDALADHQPKTLGQIEQVAKDKDVIFAQVWQAVLVLCGKGSLYPVQDEAVISKARKQTDKLNVFLCENARGSNDNGFLASPVTAGGVAVNRFQQLFLLAKSQGKKQPAEWTQFVWQVLAAQGQKIVKDGKTLDTAEENMAELTEQAQTFANKKLPILKALGIA
jgi:Predicted methyltransferase regulatory domain.